MLSRTFRADVVGRPAGLPTAHSGAHLRLKPAGRGVRFYTTDSPPGNTTVPAAPPFPDSLPETDVLMNKRQLIDDIRRYNTTAQPQFLAQFDEEALKQYLEHLEQARRKHLRNAAFAPRAPKLRMVS